MQKSIATLFVGFALTATAMTASAEKAEGNLGAAAAGKLVKVTDGKVEDFKAASPDYYVIYHSASW